MSDGTADERIAAARRPRWGYLWLLILLSAPTCVQVGGDSFRMMEGGVPPAVPQDWGTPLFLGVLLCFALALRETRGAFWSDGLAMVFTFGVTCIVAAIVLAPAQPILQRIRCHRGGSGACAWLGERARADGDRTKAVAYLEAACQGAPQRDALLYSPALACVGLATLQPQRAPALRARVSALDTYRADEASAALTACFVDPVPACADPCAQLAEERLWLGPFRVHGCLRELAGPLDRPTAPAPP
ncbi:MAG: hypothetical protein H6704_06105 [Myxococcales bacterium]|nr:hypothetical protein [Myxococcales bacterium]